MTHCGEIPALLRHRTFEAQRDKTSLEMGATWRSGYATVCKSPAGSQGSPTSEILEALKVSGTSVIFDLRSESRSTLRQSTSLL
jgi:hypothetical protein